MPSGEVVRGEAFEDFVREAVRGGEGELERRRVGEAGAVEVRGRDAALGPERLDLRRCAVDDDDADVQRAQDSDVEQEVGEVLVGDDRAIHGDDEGLLAEARDVLEDAPKVGGFHFGCADCRALNKGQARGGIQRETLHSAKRAGQLLES